MWLMTKYGFYSIVQKPSGEYHLRARERNDIENLIKHVPLTNVKISTSKSKDYAYRIIVEKTEVLAILQFLGETVDYANFKDIIDNIEDQKNKPYHEVWRVLADALGAYGRKPDWKKWKKRS